MIPQAEVKWFGSQIFWVVVFFLLNYLVSFVAFERLRKKRISFKYFLSMKTEQLESINREILLLESEVHELKELEIKEKEFIKNYLYEKMRRELDEKVLKARNTLQEERYQILQMRDFVKQSISMQENQYIYEKPLAILVQKLGV